MTVRAVRLNHAALCGLFAAHPENAEEETAMRERPDHELEVLEDDQTVPPRPEELIADAEPEPAPASRPPDGDRN